MRYCLLPAALLAALVSSAAAEEAGGSATQAALTAERHFTTNALDSDLELSDWYTLIRGSLRHPVTVAGTAVTLGGEFQATRYDNYDFEDDSAFALSAEAARKLTERLEIRGTLSWQRFSEGDDLPIQTIVLATRTRTDTLAAGLELGADLGGGWTLVTGVANRLRMPDETQFPDTPIMPVQLYPRRKTMQASVVLTRAQGRFAYGLRATFDDTHAEPLPLGVSYRLITVQAEGKATAPGGLTLAGALGLQWLGADLDLYEELRPTLQLAVVKRFENGAELRGSFAASYESDDTDDPLASWLERLEVEARMPLHARAAFGAGVFLENKHNLLLGNEERSRGVYGEITCRLGPKSDIVLRVDYSQGVLTVADVEKRTLDVYLGLTARL